MQLQNTIQMTEQLTKPTITNKHRQSQLMILKWCFIAFIFYDCFVLLFINSSNSIIQSTIESGQPHPHLTPAEFEQTKNLIDKIFWPIHFIGIIHILLCVFAFQKFQKKQWHPLILATTLLTFLILPLGPFFGLVLLVFLYHAKGKNLFQNPKEINQN